MQPDTTTYAHPMAAKRRTETRLRLPALANELLKYRNMGAPVWIFLGKNTFTSMTAEESTVSCAHLAQLSAQGTVGVIFTLCEESYIEQALFRALPAQQVQVLSSEWVTVQALASAISSPPAGTVTVVRLTGNVNSYAFRSSLNKLRANRFAPPLLLTGVSHDELPVITALARTIDGPVYIASLDDTCPETSRLLQKIGVLELSAEQPAALIPGRTVNIQSFTGLFTELNLSVQAAIIRENDKLFEDTEKSTVSLHERDTGTISQSEFARLSAGICEKICSIKPNIVYVINDPALPAGLEICRRIEPSMRPNGIRLARLDLDGSLIRTADSFSTEPGSPGDYSHVMILDAVAFSGQTLDAATEFLLRVHSPTMVTRAALIVSRQLKVEPNCHIISQRITDRFEIAFPWGTARTSKSVSRQLNHPVKADRRIDNYSRPWGTIDVLADQEPCSVRMLTLHARQRLSFQRHVCRDELFLALDEGICLELYAGQIDHGARPEEHNIKTMALRKGDYVLVPRGMWHRSKAAVDTARLLEVAFGPYDQAGDIERRWDDYNRIGQDGSR